MKSPASIIVHTYPDQNPFDADPPYPNIFPKKPVEFSYLSSTEISDALRVQDRTWCNPLAKLYGRNPFQFTDEDLIPDDDLFIENQTSPPPLPEISLSSLEFVERLNPKGRTPVYKVSATIDSVEEVRKTYALKMFRDKDPDEETKIEEIGWPMFRFRREKEAYAHLIHAGLSDQGFIPRCYGWLTITQREYLKQCYDLPVSKDDDPIEYEHRLHDQYWIEVEGPNTRERHHTLLDDRRPPKALLFEYYEGTKPLTTANTTHEIAEAALKSLYQIHAAYVLHGDISNDSNIFIIPGAPDRVMWIDFDESTCGSETLWTNKLTRQSMLEELEEVWSRLYQILLTNSNIMNSSVLQ